MKTTENQNTAQPVQDARSTQGAAGRASLAERRRNPTNCGRCGQPNANGKKTCDRCLGDMRRYNMQRKIKPVGAGTGRYFGVKVAAVYLGCSPGSIYDLVARRQIPFRRLGVKLVFDREELDAYLHALEGVDVREALGLHRAGRSTPFAGKPAPE